MPNEQRNLLVFKLYEKYQDAMIRRALKYVRNIFDAEDIVSDCWLVLMQHASILEAMVPPARSTYIMRTVQNAAIDFMRARRHHPVQRWESTMKVAAWLDTDELLDIETTVQQHEMIVTCLNQLPPHEQMALVLKMHGLRAKEAAHVMHVSESSVRSYQARAIKRLRIYVKYEDKR